MARSWTALTLVALVGCYADRINSRPVIQIHGQASAHEGDMLMYVASGGDRDDEPLTYTFEAWRCPEINRCEERVATSSTYVLPVTIPSSKDNIVVRLEVRDSAGAVARDELTVSIENGPPEITKLQVESQTNGLGGYTVGRLLQIRAEWHDADVSDTPTWQWEWFPAPGSPPGATPFTEISGTEATLRPDTVGEWTVRLTVSDGVATDQRDLAIRVDPDLDPCLGPLSPPMSTTDAPILVERDGGARVFHVASVIDDLDPYPYEVGSLDPDLGRPRFRWFLQRPGGALEEITGSDLAEYTLHPESYAPNDELTLRVEVSDRTPAWPTCAADAATCSTGAADCTQRATWKVRIR